MWGVGVMMPWTRDPGWRGARPPEPGKRLVKVSARPVTDFTTATTRAPLPATTAEDVAAAQEKLPPGSFKPMGLGAGPADMGAWSKAGGAPSMLDTKNSCYFTSAPGAHTGYASFKSPGATSQWVP